MGTLESRRTLGVSFVFFASFLGFLFVCFGFSCVLLASFEFSFHFATLSCQFQRFLRFCSLFLSIRYAFCYIPCSCFADFTCFFNFTFVSLHFATMLYDFEILRSFLFNWLYVALISLYFVQVLYRFDVFI